jgi:hypothetical protein
MSMPPILESGNALPEVVIGYVSVRSQGRTSFLDADDVTDPEPFYGSRADDTKRAVSASRSPDRPPRTRS